MRCPVLFTRRLSIAALGLLAGCARSEVAYVDRWTPTAEVCGWEEALPTYDDIRLQIGDTYYPSKACADRVLSDFNAEVPAFLEFDEYEDPYAAVSGVDGEWTRLESVLDAARGFFLLDMGEMSGVEANALTSSDFVEQLDDVGRDTGLTAVNAVLYSFVTSVVLETVPGQGTRFEPDERRLEIGGDGLFCVKGTATLVHEARHLWSVHTRCGEYNCDPDVTGAYGYQLSALELMWKNLEMDGSAGAIPADIETEMKHELMARRIASFQSGPGELLSEWEEADVAQY